MTKTISTQTRKTIKRIVVELARHPVKPNRRSFPIKLGSKSPVIINPTVKDTQNKVTDGDPTAQQTLQNKAMRESYNLYNKLIISNDAKIH